MTRSARSRRKAARGSGGLLREGLLLLAGATLRNPLAVGGTTAFVVTLAYVSANALFYQPHPHKGAYFSTRVDIESGPVQERFSVPAEPNLPPALSRPAVDTTADEVSALIEQETTSSLPKGDPQVRLVQDVLKTLDFYTGSIDGLAGPQTAKAVERYQKIVGLEATGQIDAALMQQLGAGSGDTTPAAPSGAETPLPVAAPVPQLKTSSIAATENEAEAAQPRARATDPMIIRIQAGLKAFGHDAIELDGVVGARTRAAIREFQSLFGLPETGEPDARLFAKMREVGLAD